MCNFHLQIAEILFSSAISVSLDLPHSLYQIIAAVWMDSSPGSTAFKTMLYGAFVHVSVGKNTSQKTSCWLRNNSFDMLRKSTDVTPIESAGCQLSGNVHFISIGRHLSCENAGWMKVYPRTSQVSHEDTRGVIHAAGPIITEWKLKIKNTGEHLVISPEIV